MDKGEKPFRYEAMWKSHPNFDEFVLKNWSPSNSFSASLNSLAVNLKKWNNDVFGNVFKRKRKVLNRINGIQKASTYGRNPFLKDLEQQLVTELEEILNQEETLCLQKSRQNWIVDRDRNTRYYHTKTAIRRKKNRILKLRKSDGQWCDQQERVMEMVMNFFKALYQEENGNCTFLNTIFTFPELRKDLKDVLSIPPSYTQIQKALFDIRSLKVLREDGFPALFYKENWNVIKGSFIPFILQLWHNPRIIESINQTLVTLIPKVPNPEFVSQFRPIALVMLLIRPSLKL
ncbi:uncharacterized protein LOC107475230 [Arachis duranensis]|uniref:Uncharacterized protein LOC107475230 n=1 Tax=Arachis duranensis TaxID=130453 RepID=A0A6P4CFY0_ARADU|nr:uncharacterized protein LOC107475230 [Arachis duranensis]